MMLVIGKRVILFIYESSVIVTSLDFLDERTAGRL
jgi:hypothetical protein